MRNSLVTGILGLIVGMAIGFFTANNLNRNAPAAPHAAVPPGMTAPPGTATQMPGGDQAGMMTDVSQTLEKAKNEPTNFEAQMSAGDLYAQIQRVDRAAEFFDAAAKLNVTEYDRMVRLANGYFDIRQYEKAQPLYLKAAEQKPDDINVRTDLAVTFVEQSQPDYERAMKEFDAALKINPKHEPTLYNLGVAYFKKGDTENAKKTLARLEEAKPGNELATRLKQTLEQGK